MTLSETPAPTRAQENRKALKFVLLVVLLLVQYFVGLSMYLFARVAGNPSRPFSEVTLLTGALLFVSAVLFELAVLFVPTLRVRINWALLFGLAATVLGPLLVLAS